jgi:hypothetical protein
MQHVRVEDTNSAGNIARFFATTTLSRVTMLALCLLSKEMISPICGFRASARRNDLAGFATTYPVNWWLIGRGTKEKM